MIGIESKLTGDVSHGLDKLAEKVQEKVLFSGVAAMAKVIYEAVLPNVPVKSGLLKSAIYRVYSPERSTGQRKTYRVSWNKKKAPHGHLVEFGTSRAPARPFLRPAFDRINEAIQQGKEAMAEKMSEVSVE